MVNKKRRKQEQKGTKKRRRKTKGGKKNLKKTDVLEEGERKTATNIPYLTPPPPPTPDQTGKTEEKEHVQETFPCTIFTFSGIKDESSHPVSDHLLVTSKHRLCPTPPSCFGLAFILTTTPVNLCLRQTNRVQLLANLNLWNMLESQCSLLEQRTEET